MGMSIRTRRSEVLLHAPELIEKSATMQNRLAAKAELVALGTIVWRFLPDETSETTKVQLVTE
jgi:hypothetical protein